MFCRVQLTLGTPLCALCIQPLFICSHYVSTKALTTGHREGMDVTLAHRYHSFSCEIGHIGQKIRVYVIYRFLSEGHAKFHLTLQTAPCLSSLTTIFLTQK